MQQDGHWQKGQPPVCSWKTGCTVCAIPNTPVFTLKGMCDFGEADWNYYLALDNTNAIQFLEGYKRSNIVKNNINQEWEISGKIHTLKGTGGRLLANDRRKSEMLANPPLHTTHPPKPCQQSNWASKGKFEEEGKRSN